MLKQERYLSYLLRLWQSPDDGPGVWRSSLELVGTGQRHGFASLRHLFAYLWVKTEQADADEVAIAAGSDDEAAT